MKNNRRILAHIICVVFGAALLVLGAAGIVEEFWLGMGSALVMVGILRMVRMYRFRKDADYREMVETEANDERSHFIRGRAWAWAGYMFVIIAGVAVIVLRVMGQDMLSMAAFCAMCLILLLYWISYIILRKKY